MPGHYVSHTWRHDPSADAPAKYRRACKYDAFIPARLQQRPLHLEATVAGLVSESEAAIRNLNDAARPALAPLARLLLRTESIASSKIEGMQTGIRELARAEARIESGGKAGATALEVLANIDAMELAMSEAAGAERVRVTEIVAIHRRLMARTSTPTPGADRIAGRIRTSQNWIGGNDDNPCGADFVPPPPEDVTGLLGDLCAAINDHRLPPLVQAALVHAQFETIHPFADGNGRTGGALIHVVLKRRGVAPAYVPPISVVLAAERDRYIAGLSRFRGDDVAAWIEQFATAARSAALLASAYVGKTRDLIDSWRAKLGAQLAAPRADAAAWSIIEILPAHPMITAPVVAAVIRRSKPQVYEAIGQLEAAGVLVPLSQSRRNRSWEGDGLLDLLAAFESGLS